MALATVFGEATPAKSVDKVWHSHITDTRRYPADCKKCFGEYMHHYPYFGLGVNARNGVDHGEREALWNRYKVTLQRYIFSFNEIPPREVWGDNIYHFGSEVDSMDIGADPKVSCCSTTASGVKSIDIAVDPKVSCSSSTSCHSMTASGVRSIDIAADPKVSCCSSTSCHSMTASGVKNIDTVVDPKVSCCSSTSCHTSRASNIRSKL